MKDRGDAVVELLRASHHNPILAFGLTAAKEPRHPLYLPGNASLISITAQA